jgi:hypothetical protein
MSIFFRFTLTTFVLKSRGRLRAGCDDCANTCSLQLLFERLSNQAASLVIEIEFLAVPGNELLDQAHL